MIDLTKKKWDFSKEEQYAVDWFDKNGYNVTLKKQFISKTIFLVEKDGIEDSFELLLTIKGLNIREYMENYRKQWDMLVELRQLRAQAGK
ncbi:MAG: hypothetical protein LUF68_04660 [Clostridiales bacterium]|nr:hypothetical protein [Clostridiales bacterium]